ncbi:MAG TPA: hypothetical protein P5560_07880, partial [Thermotogota bacterium]|nr:hypothetical protein [Thermotogota bacterium]
MAVKTRHSFRKWVALAAALFFLPLCGLGVFLGVAVIEMPPSDPLLGETRLVVGKVLEQGLAYGLLQPGDVLLRVAREGAKVLALQKSQQLGEFLEECSPEQVLLFHVLRDQQPMEVRVPLKKEPPSAPFFRFHSSMHLSEIRDLSVHPFGEWLATVSLDKTLKLWRLPELELFQTVHFPSDSGDSGKMYAVAVSPDGSELACAGWGGDWQSGQCVFLLDTSTWQVKQVLEGMPDIAFSLEYSPGGEWLCA